MVCRPKDEGELGVINLELQKKAMIMKNLHKFCNKINLPWVNLLWEQYYSHDLPTHTTPEASFWWKDTLKQLATYKGNAHCRAQQGKTVLFWQDRWNDNPLATTWPQLHSFVINQFSTNWDIANFQDLTDLFHLPLFAEAHH